MTILETLATKRERLRAVVDGLSEADLDRREGDGWSIREILTHLLNAEEDHCRVIAVVAKGQAHHLPADFALDEHNAQRLAERGHLTGPDLLSALAAQRARTEALFHRLRAEQLDWVAPHPALGDKTLGDIFRVIGLHETMHTREIEALVGRG
jgi:uncharacterized damage-inducible protein DinB